MSDVPNNNVAIVIKNLIMKNNVVLFIKGEKQEPRCGFSQFVVKVLDDLNVDFLDINVLADDEMRQGIKDYSDWPTIPQLYIKGEFVGGCDIVREMFISGDLQSLLKSKGVM
ncbi:putative monothiol glutaredoxin 2 [Candidatus Xenohaliotis californiensis]|uniref:Glutaredoxin n=1 Tax=Candidatus Xenohaliotis californiensis TaxID=84677 RepID=A0ABP0EVR8_9RICK|nr:putative monothiol glutaredoxin 2 [Candidatus Xenohaliotis californiensis]